MVALSGRCATKWRQPAVVRQLGDVTEHEEGARRWCVTNRFGLRVLAYCVGTSGNVPAAAELSRLLVLCSPKLVLLTGIAAGMPGAEMRLGDVMVAEQVLGYQSAKVWEDRVEIRLRIAEAGASVFGVAESVARDDQWNINLPEPPESLARRPSAFIGNQLSGEEVVADPIYRDDLRRLWPNIIGLEMESIGVAVSACRADSIPEVLVAKAACDWGDGDKDDLYHEFASETSAAFSMAVLERISGTLLDRQRPIPRAPRSDGLMRNEFVNRVLNEYVNLLTGELGVEQRIESQWPEKGPDRARKLWDWCRQTGRLSELPTALRKQGRNDLADLFYVEGELERMS